MVLVSVIARRERILGAKNRLCGKIINTVEQGLLLYLHVRTVGISEVNMRKRSEKNKQPVLLNTLLPSFPMP